MWQPSDVAEKKFNEETHRLIGEAKLHEFGNFLDEFCETASRQAESFQVSFTTSPSPILLDVSATEGVSILYLTHSDNKILARILSTLGGICNEIDLLIQEADQIYPAFIFYGDESGDTIDNVEHISKLLEPLQKVQGFVARARRVIILTLRQLCAILQKGFFTSSNVTSFPETLNCFAKLLICLLKFDSLLESQILKDHWFMYRRSVRNLSHSNKYNLPTENIRSFDKTLVILENSLLTGRILKETFEKCLEDKVITEIKKCTLVNEFSAFLSMRINELEKDEDIVLYDELWLQLNVTVAFFFNIFGSTDKKFIKRLMELNKKSSACTLVGNIVWYPEQFLLRHVQSLVKHIDEKGIESSRISLIHNRNQNLPKEASSLCLQACHFLIEVEALTKLNRNNLKVRQLQEFSNLFLDGLRLVHKIRRTITWIMNLHADKNLPVTKSVLSSLSKLIEILKGIYLTFMKNVMTTIYLVVLVSQHLSHKALSIIHTMKKHLTQERSYKEHELDVISALNVCEHALKGPITNHRLLVANLALSASGLSGFNLLELRTILNKVDLITNMISSLSSCCDCSFLYWHHNYLLPVYFSKLIASKSDLSRYSLMLAASSDFIKIGGSATWKSVNSQLKTYFLNPLNQIVETNLRLQTHLHLQLPPSDPFKDYFSLNFSKYLPAPLHDQFKSIKHETEHWLSTMFYNLTTVVLHDWKTYGEMRKLAYLQYGLETVDDELPMQTLEQGLDVLEVMRNINLFTQKYLYNLNCQVFIEASSNNKHLNSINISHVANSIRTHGIGIMNTTVNFTYQFLKKKFYIFSQFMFDEHIKSRLLKDIRFFNEHKTELNQMYPYDRADKFNIGIRKLGLNQSGESYLDLFRKAITHIGNAMGYVRLIRSGGKRCIADGTCFIPDLKDVDHLRNLLEDPDDFPELTKNASEGLLQELQNFIDNFEEATEYFKLLVEVFVPVFRSKNNIHLKNFYIIVPPLTINFVENSLTCKERMYKKNKTDGAFTDDGFALGLAYIIELLDQETQLNSLHWFNSVQNKFRNDRLKIKEQALAANSDDAKLTQTLNLTEKRIKTFEREFQLLYYSMSSARLFFR